VTFAKISPVSPPHSFDCCPLLVIDRTTLRSAGRCMVLLRDGNVCQDHGDVTIAVERYKNGGGYLTDMELEALTDPNNKPTGLRKEGDRLVCDECAGFPSYPPDCNDNSCVSAFHKHGMRTNGGCRCHERDLRVALRWWRHHTDQKLLAGNAKKHAALLEKDVAAGSPSARIEQLEVELKVGRDMAMRWHAYASARRASAKALESIAKDGDVICGWLNGGAP